MVAVKKILLKLTGQVLSADYSSNNHALIGSIIDQIKALKSTHQFALVVGGGNFFKGSVQGRQLQLKSSVGHQIGMLATMMNGLILKDLFEQQQIATQLLSAIDCAQIGNPISQQAIDQALAEKKVIIFAGGTGNPFFTTDTNAVLRGLQIQADEIWKATDVEGVYDSNPKTNPAAIFLKRLTFADALHSGLGVMDATAFTLAKEHRQTIRVFNIFTPNSLLEAAGNNQFGSTIY